MSWAGRRGPRSPSNNRLHVFLGTKAQYVKTAPLLRLLDERGVDYRLIDSGQHAALSVSMRAELGVRAPDHVLGGESDVESVPQALAWAAGVAGRLWSGRRVREEIFGGAGGVCVVHGDTPSTLLSTLLARRAGLRVAHLEAGLRSHHLLHPFPEEMIRVAVMRLAHVLFTPHDEAERNLAAMRGVRARVVPLPANTSLEGLVWALSSSEPVAPASGPALITMHRVENLHRRSRVATLVDAARKLAVEREQQVCWILYGPTARVLARRGDDRRLRAAGVELVPTVEPAVWARLLAGAPFVITDGGSTQEECALLGVPTLLWRGHTERPDGLGANVVLSGHDPAVVAQFLADPERYRRPPAPLDARPSERILEVLLEERRAKG